MIAVTAIPAAIEYTGVAEPRFRRVVSHPSGKSEPVLRNDRPIGCEAELVCGGYLRIATLKKMPLYLLLYVS